MKILCTWDDERGNGPEGKACSFEADRFFYFKSPVIYQAVCNKHIESRRVDYHYEEITREEYLVAMVMFS